MDEHFEVLSIWLINQLLLSETDFATVVTGVSKLLLLLCNLSSPSGHVARTLRSNYSLLYSSVAIGVFSWEGRVPFADRLMQFICSDA